MAMSVEPASGRKEFQGFDAFYARNTAPYLKANEAARQRAVLQSALIAIAAAVAAFAGFRLPAGFIYRAGGARGRRLAA